MDNKVNASELSRVIRLMQDESLARSKEANKFNQLAADIVQRGADDKMRSKGWPISSVVPPWGDRVSGVL